MTLKPEVDWRQKFQWYWPELDRYCGCANLKTGIYIRTSIGVLVNILYMFSNGSMICYLFEVKGRVNKFFEESDSILVHRSKDDLTPEDISKTILLTYVLSWIVLKVLHILMALLLIFALFKRIPKILKSYVYFSVPIWIVDIIVSAIGFVFSTPIIKALVMACLLTEGYNLLAINSEYKVQSGKSRLISDDKEPDVVIANEFISTAHRNITFQNEYTNPHCNTCTCPLTTSSCTNPSIVSTDISTETDIEQKYVNFKEEPVIYDQDQLRGAEVEEDKLDKKEIDSPVIYDTNQLNVGSNHVIEDRMDSLPRTITSVRKTFAPIYTTL